MLELFKWHWFKLLRKYIIIIIISNIQGDLVFKHILCFEVRIIIFITLNINIDQSVKSLFVVWSVVF